MEWALAAVAVVILAAAAILGTGRWGAMPPVVDDRYPGFVPDGWLDGDDVRDVRFAVVPRGYSMTQVDALLARLADQLDQGRLDQGSASGGWPAASGSDATDADGVGMPGPSAPGVAGASAHHQGQDENPTVTTANMPDGIFRLPPGSAV